MAQADSFLRLGHRIERQDRELLRDSRCSNQQLAEHMAMLASVCWRRALEEAGIVTRYAAMADHEKAGFATSAILHVSLDRHDEKDVTRIRRCRTADA